MLEPVGGGDAAPRGFLRLGGASLARHQLSLALATGCTRIICLARTAGSGITELGDAAEAGGASFHLISGPRGLSSLVTAADEMLILFEGVQVPASDAQALLERGPCVLVQPAETGIPAGFERIDLNHASAGVLTMPGRLVDRLMDLPDDVDPASSLLRIALQAGVPQHPVPAGLRHAGRWLMIRDEAEAQAAEDGWMKRATATQGTTPGPFLARTLVRRFGSAVLHAGSGTVIGAVGAALITAIGFATAWFGAPALGMVLAGSGWVLRHAAGMLEQLEDELLARPPRHRWRQPAFDLALDAVMAGILVIALPALPGKSLFERSFAPIVLLGLIRLLPRMIRAGWTAWISDRFLLALLLAMMISGKVAGLGVPALAVLLIGAGLVLGRPVAPDEPAP